MRIDDRSGIRVLHLEPEGEALSTSDDASDLVGSAWSHDAAMVAVPVGRFDPAFFDLRSGVAGEITQKLVNYRIRLTVVGDLTEHVAASDALRDYIWESNRGEHIWFVDDEAALAEKLAAR
ncbi:MAG: DUF4180 domain-containing protein [Actinomycetota bacterium]|nr:DUF4180 domain-containing protein [Actinomycetota bacterium]